MNVAKATDTYCSFAVAHGFNHGRATLENCRSEAPVRVTWVISPNGLGHARRSLAVASCLRDLMPEIEITLVAELWQRDRLGDHGFTWRRGGLAEAPRWPHRPGSDLLAWRDRLAQSGALHDADRVVSDNLAGVLALRPDTILEGSFLWSDILDGVPGCEAFVADERALLAAHRPIMVCVHDMAMPGVHERARAVGVEWMGDGVPSPTRRSGGQVAVLGGASGAADGPLADLASALTRKGVSVVTAFDHSPAAYAACDVVVCRPGLGTVTDCILAGVPMVLHVEDDHPEMVWNTRRLVELGMAVAPATVDTVTQILADEATRTTMAARAAARPRGGAATAARLVASQLVVSKEIV
jgi:hypothetical protein